MTTTIPIMPAPDSAMALHPCPACDASGQSLTAEEMGGEVAYVLRDCATCHRTGWATEPERKAYWRSYFRARNAAWGPVRIYGLREGELDALEDDRADAAEAAHAAALEER